MIGKSKPNPVNVGDQIGNYTIENIIATGLNCFIYSGKLKNTITTSVAIKTEIDIPSRTALSREIIVLEAVKNQKHFAKIIETGNYKEFRFVVTDLLGPNLRDLAHRKEPHRFGLQILLKFAYQAFESLQTLHQAGFIHRNVESKNFVIGFTKQTAGIFYLIDYSTCRKFNFSDTSRGNLLEQTKKNQSKPTFQQQQKQTTFSTFTSMKSDQSYEQLQIVLESTPEEDLMRVMNIISEYYTGKDQVAEMINRV